jgi:AraC-like DNA-binding protein
MQSILFRVLPPIQEKDVASCYSYCLSQDKIDSIGNELKRFMLDQKPFLRTGYCIRELATEIRIPAYQVSAYINQHLGMNFNDYFNWFRVRHCQDLMQKGLVNRLNLRGLAYRCGFNNRNTLTTAFKKFTGVTPSEYSRSVSQNNPGIYVIWEGVTIDQAPEK